jgi:hypothetical protein
MIVAIIDIATPSAHCVDAIRPLDRLYGINSVPASLLKRVRSETTRPFNKLLAIDPEIVHYKQKCQAKNYLKYLNMPGPSAISF